MDRAAPIWARGIGLTPLVHACASRFRMGMQMLQNGTGYPLGPAARLEAFERGDSGGVGWCSVEAVSLLLHKRFLLEFVDPGMRVLEVGAGTGTFTQTLAEVGCRVVVAEMSVVRLSNHRARSVQLAIDHAVEGRVVLDTRELSPIAEGSFDLVVCFGGASGESLAEEIPAIAEGARVCRPGGRVLLSVLSLSGAVHHYLNGRLLAPPEKRAGVTISEDRPLKSWLEARRRCQMFRAEELRRTAQEAGLEVLAMSASNSLSLGWKPFLPATGDDQERRRELLSMEFVACREEDSLDMGRRILLAGKKR